ncbi:MAG: YncE family protein [Gemmatimonadales bacterium]
MRHSLTAGLLLAATALPLAGCSSDSTTTPSTGVNTSPEMVMEHPLSGQPYAVAIASSGEAYVSRLSVDLLARIDLPGTTVTDSVTVTGAAPTGIAFLPNGTAAFIANQASTGVTRVHVGTDAVDTTIGRSGDMFQTAAAPDGGRVYVTGSTGYVYAINPAINAVVDSVHLGGATNGMAFSPDGQSLYVGNLTDNTVRRIHLATLIVDQTDTLTGRIQGLAVSPDGSELWVADQDADSVYVVSTTTRQVLASIWVGAPFGLALRPGTGQVWVTTLDGYVVVLDRTTRMAVGGLPLGGTLRHIAFNADGSRAVVADGSGRVLILR